MATIKSYTDINQSRKLSEFLPLESADMFLAMNGTLPVMSKYIDDGLVTADETAIPCWSLAALLSVLPEGTRLLKSTTDETYHCDCPKGNIDKWFDSPVDACVAMIEKLHEHKML